MKTISQDEDKPNGSELVANVDLMDVAVDVGATDGVEINDKTLSLPPPAPATGGAGANESDTNIASDTTTTTTTTTSANSITANANVRPASPAYKLSPKPRNYRHKLANDYINANWIPVRMLDTKLPLSLV